jgi:hypothetical protein
MTRCGAPGAYGGGLVERDVARWPGGRMSSTTYLMVPVKAKGALSSGRRSTTSPLSRPMSRPA